MRIAIIGAGRVGGTLARAWARSGHEIYLGLRDPKAQKYQELARQLGTKGRLGFVPQACAESEAVLLSVPWAQARSAVQSAGDLKGKLLLDCTNPIKFQGREVSLVVGLYTSAAEQVASWAGEASVFKIFNHIGAGLMDHPDFGGSQPLMCVCGDDETLKPSVLLLASDLGFDAVDAGKLSAARYLEPLAALWLHLAVAQEMGSNIAFGLLRK
jgi:predicted dinucleotide-binding enzyme